MWLRLKTFEIAQFIQINSISPPQSLKAQSFWGDLRHMRKMWPTTSGFEDGWIPKLKHMGGLYRLETRFFSSDSPRNIPLRTLVLDLGSVAQACEAILIVATITEDKYGSLMVWIWNSPLKTPLTLGSSADGMAGESYRNFRRRVTGGAGLLVQPWSPWSLKI